MATQPRPLLRITVRKTVHLVTTLEVYAYPSAPPPKPVIETTGEEARDAELPAPQPGIRAARPANVVAFPVRRTGTRGMTTVQALMLAACLAVAGLASVTYAASLGNEPAMGEP